MRIKPILFSTPMVRAILDGRKTMTRRVVKPQPIANDQGVYWINPPYPFEPNNILWVRETVYFETFYRPAGEGDWIYRADNIDYPTIPGHWKPSIFMPKDACRIWLRVTDVRAERVQDITNNDAIKEGCAGAECDCLRIGRSWMGCESCMNTGWQEPPVVEFMQLWDDLNAKRGYSWDANPWVWVISFERCDKPQEVTP